VERTRAKLPAEPTEATVRADAPRPHEHLQQQAGNRAVTRAVQRLRVTPTSDPSEHEADLLAPFVASRLGGIQEQIGGGQRLPSAVRTEAEAELGTDLSDVRVHTGPDVDRDADALDANAYTRDLDVYVSGGELRSTNLGHRATLAHELTHVAQQQGGTARVRRSVPRGVVQRQPKGHELTKTSEFQTRAKEYETRLGFYAYNNDRAAGGAAPMIDAVRRSIRALAAKYPRPDDSEERQERLLHSMLVSRDSKGQLSLKARQAGQVGAAVAEAIQHGSLREQYTMLYNATRSDAFKMLFVPGQEYTTMQKLLFWKGERHSTSTQTSKGGWTWNVASTRFWTQLWSRRPFRTKKLDKQSTRTPMDLNRGYEQGGRRYGAPITGREARVMYGEEPEEDPSEARLPWKEGGSKYQLDETNPWVERVKGELGMPVTSGPSGTTLRMLEAFDAVKTGQENLGPYLLGLLAWMMTGNDHSFHEVMSVAKAQGTAPNYTPGAMAYRKHVPLIQEPELRQNVAVEKMFPDEHAYLSQLEHGALAGGAAWTKFKPKLQNNEPLSSAKVRLATAIKKLEELQAQQTELVTKLDSEYQQFLEVNGDNYPKNQLKTVFEGFYEREVRELGKVEKKITAQEQYIELIRRQVTTASQSSDGRLGGLSRAHIAALNVYTSPMYRAVNPQYKSGAWFRTYASKEKLASSGGKLPEDTGEIQEQARLHGEMIEGALSQLPNYTGTLLFRGDGDGARSPGKRETIDSFTSTSKLPDKALQYALGDSPALVIMSGLSGGKDISELTISSSLEQVLLPPGAKFKYLQRVSLQVPSKVASTSERGQISLKNRNALAAISEDVLPPGEREKILSWTTRLLPVTDPEAETHPYGKTLSVMIAAVNPPPSKTRAAYPEAASVSK
jgi:Domain of unknown function (DUF4157)